MTEAIRYQYIQGAAGTHTCLVSYKNRLLAKLEATSPYDLGILVGKLQAEHERIPPERLESMSQYRPLASRWCTSCKKDTLDGATLRGPECLCRDCVNRAEDEGHGILPDARAQTLIHWQMSEDEKARGFVRPLRDSYVHRVCHHVNTMGQSMAETLAKKPTIFSTIYCIGCKAHRPVGEFLWDGTELTVGS